MLKNKHVNKFRETDLEGEDDNIIQNSMTELLSESRRMSSWPTDVGLLEFDIRNCKQQYYKDFRGEFFLSMISYS